MHPGICLQGDLDPVKMIINLNIMPYTLKK